jgi:hypothetical protein
MADRILSSSNIENIADLEAIFEEKREWEYSILAVW